MRGSIVTLQHGYRQVAIFRGFLSATSSEFGAMHDARAERLAARNTKNCVRHGRSAEATISAPPRLLQDYLPDCVAVVRVPGTHDNAHLPTSAVSAGFHAMRPRLYLISKAWT